MKKRRQSPGGVATCAACGSIVSRGKINRHLRAGTDWKCNCGGTRLEFSRPYIMRKPTPSSTAHFIWAHKRRAGKEAKRG